MMQTFDALGSKVFVPTNSGTRVPERGYYIDASENLCFSINGVLQFRINTDGTIYARDWSFIIPAIQPYYALLQPPPQIVTAGTTTLMGVSQYEVEIKKAAPASHTVTLPPAPIAGQKARVSDGKGDLIYDTVSLTVRGSGGVTINDQASHVMWGAWSSTEYRFDGTQWNISGRV